MKGLLLKDFYTFKRYCRAHVVLVLAFGLYSAVAKGSAFFLFYPCIWAALVAMTLMAYEEREKWDLYAATLPYSKGQIVSSKYMVSLLFGLATVIFVMGVQAAVLLAEGRFQGTILVNLLLTLLPAALLPTALFLPLIWKYGTEKGKIMFYGVIGVCSALTVLLPTEQLNRLLEQNGSAPGLLFSGAAVALYGLSWLLSIRFYEKRGL